MELQLLCPEPQGGTAPFLPCDADLSSERHFSLFFCFVLGHPVTAQESLLMVVFKESNGIPGTKPRSDTCPAHCTISSASENYFSKYKSLGYLLQ